MIILIFTQRRGDAEKDKKKDKRIKKNEIKIRNKILRFY